MFQQEIDRQKGYRPGVGLLLIDNAKQVLLGQRANWLSCMKYDEGKYSFEDQQDWMFGWDIPQGGIEPGETFRQTIHREIREELGENWEHELIGSSRMFRREQLDFPFERDGRRWRGKTYYYHVVASDLPGFGPSLTGGPAFMPGLDYFDWVYGPHQDDGPYPFPTREFPGGVLFMAYEEAKNAVSRTQRGKKGQLLLNLLGDLKREGVIV